MKRYLISQMCAKEKITATQLINEIQILFKDEIVARLKNKENILSVEYLNGQTFEIIVKEI